MEAEDYFETLTPTGHIAESHFSEDKNLHSYRSDNLKSHEVYEQLEKSRAFLFFSRWFLGLFKDADQLHKLHNVWR